ncbi:MAG: four helix bundle protein [Candidatus Cloacimonetes bacterium]|nr:four helix bundle protein [Candidatus Cloacimonadota bacterium]
MNKEELKERTKTFAHRCVKLSLSLPKTKLAQHISGQLIRCSTSVAANYRAVCLAQSKASFISKISIVLEEMDVPINRDWLEFILEENLMTESQVSNLIKEANELTAIFFSSRKTVRIN